MAVDNEPGMRLLLEVAAGHWPFWHLPFYTYLPIVLIPEHLFGQNPGHDVDLNIWWGIMALPLAP